MNNPKLYRQANALQRHDAAQVIAEFLPKLQWRPDGIDTLIDVGSASGDVLMDLVYPQLPKTFQRIVCSDINSKMVEFARMGYQHLEKREFKIFDIATKSELSNDLKGQFDHVTSFYCLQLVKDQRQFFQNIFNLLRSEGGDCLITSGVVTIHHEASLCLSKIPKWSLYMKDIDEYKPPFRNAEDIRKHTSDLLASVEFKDYIVEVRDREYIFQLEDYKNTMKAVSPYIHRIPEDMHKEFIEELLEAMNNWDLDRQLLNNRENTGLPIFDGPIWQRHNF